MYVGGAEGKHGSGGLFFCMCIMELAGTLTKLLLGGYVQRHSRRGVMGGMSIVRHEGRWGGQVWV